MACALAAQERGLSVALIDRDAPGDATSFGNAGVVSPWSCVPQSLPGVWKSVPRWLLDPAGPVKVRWRDALRLAPWFASFLRHSSPRSVGRIADAMDRLMQGNIETYRRYLAGTGRDDLVVDSWYVYLFRGEQRASLDDLAFQLRIERGAPVEVAGAAELRSLEPAVAPDYHSAVLIKDQARVRSPGDLCKVLADRFVAQGGAFHRMEITALRPKADGTVSLVTATGELATERLVLAAGIWSAELLRPLGVDLPLVAERGYHLEFGNPGVAVHNSLMDVSGKVVISSMNRGVRVAGTAEFAAVDAPPNFARARALAPLAQRVLPGLNTTDARPWMGIRPSFPDSLPAIGALPGLPNLVAAFGHSHYGLGMAPATGRLVVESVLGDVRNDVLPEVNPGRF